MHKLMAYLKKEYRYCRLGHSNKLRTFFAVFHLLILLTILSLRDFRTLSLLLAHCLISLEFFVAYFSDILTNLLVSLGIRLLVTTYLQIKGGIFRNRLVCPRFFRWIVVILNKHDRQE